MRVMKPEKFCFIRRHCIESTKLVSLNFTVNMMDLLTRITNYKNCTKIGENYQHFRDCSENCFKNCESKRFQTVIAEYMP